MKVLKILILLLISLGPLNSITLAENLNLPTLSDPDEVDTNPHVLLYRQRFENRMLLVEKAVVLHELRSRNFVRARKLIEKKAISQQEYDTLEFEWKTSSIEITETVSRAKEAKALYEISRSRIFTGQEMPICID